MPRSVPCAFISDSASAFTALITRELGVNMRGPMHVSTCEHAHAYGRTWSDRRKRAPGRAAIGEIVREGVRAAPMGLAMLFWFGLQSIPEHPLANNTEDQVAMSARRE